MIEDKRRLAYAGVCYGGNAHWKVMRIEHGNKVSMVIKIVVMRRFRR